MRHEPDIDRLRRVRDVVLLHSLRLCNGLGLDLDIRRAVGVGLVQIAVQHLERLADILLARRIDQHVGGRVVGVVHPHHVLIGQVEDIRDRAARIKCGRGVPIQVFVQLAGYKVQRILRRVQVAQAQLVIHDAVILRFAVRILDADALLPKDIRLGAQAREQHTGGVNVREVIEILLIRSGEHIGRVILARVGVDLLRDRAVLQNVHQVIERILLAPAQQRMLEHVVRALAVLGRGTEADRKLARFAAVVQPHHLRARVRVLKQMVGAAVRGLGFDLGKAVLPVAARRKRLHRCKRYQERRGCHQRRQLFFHGIHLVFLCYLYCVL